MRQAFVSDRRKVEEERPMMRIILTYYPDIIIFVRVRLVESIIIFTRAQPDNACMMTFVSAPVCEHFHELSASGQTSMSTTLKWIAWLCNESPVNQTSQIVVSFLDKLSTRSITYRRCLSCFKQ